MLKNYFKIAWRNLWRNKSFSLLNISGLAIGIAAASLIIIWLLNEVSFDRFHANGNRIYNVYNNDINDGKIITWNTTPKVMAKAIQQDYPEVESVVRVNWPTPYLFTAGEKKLKANGNIVDSGFLKMFSFPFVKGDAKTALNNNYSIVVTESLSKKLFGNEEAVGKTVLVDNRDNFTVTGVIKNLPPNTQFEFEYLIPWSYLRSKNGDDDNWSNNSTNTFVMLKKEASLASITPKIKTLRSKYDKESPKMETFLYPISRSYLYGSFENGKETGGRIEMIRLFAIIAAFIILIACINFMNLSTARSERRAKEVGIRKVVGAERYALIKQFLGESILMSFIAGIVGLLIIWFSLPYFGELVQKKLALHFNDYRFWLSGISFILFTGLLAGSYPALYLSNFRPVAVLKGTFKKVHALVTPRKILVITQFTFAIILIIGTIVVRLQLQNAQDRQSGYSKDNLIYSFLEGDLEKNYPLIKNELLSSGLVVSVTKTSAPITEGWSNSWGFGWKGKDPQDKTIVNRYCADDDIAKTAGFQIVQGRDIDLDKFPTDSTAVLINESAVKLMKFKNPVGEIINDNGIDWHVVGVIKDFILTSVYRPVEPMVIEGAKGWFNVMHIKFNQTKTTAQNLAAAEQVFKKYNPDYPFEYTFVDESYARKFENEKRTAKLAGLFAFLTIFISCLGLFGLASFMAEARIKEIGVRKVLGASVSGITGLLSKDFLKLVLISIVIATPLAYWFMYQWLQDYPYRISIQWWVFLLAGCGAILIAFLTVSFQAIKAAVANPIKSLRTE
ncbi:MAG: ABC transporter permease [Chitinophagaceae bacterium]|nr:ABC transporter permease [Chitinophagaceae bacterium]